MRAIAVDQYKDGNMTLTSKMNLTAILTELFPLHNQTDFSNETVLLPETWQFLSGNENGVGTGGSKHSA